MYHDLKRCLKLNNALSVRMETGKVASVPEHIGILLGSI